MVSQNKDSVALVVDEGEVAGLGVLEVVVEVAVAQLVLADELALVVQIGDLVEAVEEHVLLLVVVQEDLDVLEVLAEHLVGDEQLAARPRHQAYLALVLHVDLLVANGEYVAAHVVGRPSTLHLTERVHEPEIAVVLVDTVVGGAAAALAHQEDARLVHEHGAHLVLDGQLALQLEEHVVALEDVVALGLLEQEEEGARVHHVRVEDAHVLDLDLAQHAAVVVDDLDEEALDLAEELLVDEQQLVLGQDGHLLADRGQVGGEHGRQLDAAMLELVVQVAYLAEHVRLVDALVVDVADERVDDDSSSRRR